MRTTEMRRSDLVVVTGVPGAGKSSLVIELCCRMAQAHRWRTVIASFEMQAKTDLLQALRSFHAEKLEMNMTAAEIVGADEWVSRHFGFIVPNEERDLVTLEWMLETAAQAVLRKEAHILVLDPWNQLDHDRPSAMTGTEYVAFALKQLKRFARKYRIHMLLVAHPAKLMRTKTGTYPIPSLYDIADSSHFANAADAGIIVHREDARSTDTLIRIAKTRYRAIGRPGDLKADFNIDTSRYTIRDGA